MTRSRRSLFWMASLLLVVTLHVALFIWALYWHPQAIVVEPPPAAMLVELQPQVAAKPAPPVIQQPEPEPEPQPKLIEAPKPKLVIAQPKPKPKPRPPQPKPQPVQTPAPETAQASTDAATTAQQQAAAGQSAPSEDNQARAVWLS